jgi:uncharacterized membrane protein
VTEVGVPASPPPGSKERRLRLLLIASVAVNLLVIGAIAGAMLTWKKHGPRFGGHRGEDFGLMALTRALPPERRGPIRKAIKEDRASLKPLWHDIARARLDAADVLASESYSRDRLKEAIAKITEAEIKLRSAGREMFLNIADQLNPAERRELSEWWRTKAERHFGRHGKDAKPDNAKEPLSP